MTHTKTFATMEVPLTVKVWSEKPFILHNEIAKGISSVDGEPFEVWQQTNGVALYVNHGDKSYEVSVRDIVAGIFDKIKENK